MGKEKLKTTKTFIIVHIISLLIMICLLMMGFSKIVNTIFIIFYAISFIWRIKLLKDENKLSINNILGAVIVYGVGYYMVLKNIFQN